MKEEGGGGGGGSVEGQGGVEDGEQGKKTEGEWREGKKGRKRGNGRT